VSRERWTGVRPLRMRPRSRPPQGSGGDGWDRSYFLTKIAPTSSEPFIFTVQRPPPSHGPSQPINRECGRGVAVSLTRFPNGNRWLHFLPQRIPAGELVTRPAPSPKCLTVSLCAIARVKVNHPALLRPKPVSAPSTGVTRA